MKGNKFVDPTHCNRRHPVLKNGPSTTPSDRCSKRRDNVGFPALAWILSHLLTQHGLHRDWGSECSLDWVFALLLSRAPSPYTRAEKLCSHGAERVCGTAPITGKKSPRLAAMNWGGWLRSRCTRYFTR
eukprot:876572-Amphidinium_carterae.1